MDNHGPSSTTATRIQGGWFLFESILQANEALKDEESLSSMTPVTRNLYVSGLQSKRKNDVARMLELDGMRNQNNTT